MKVILADPAGACYGVERALGLAEETAAAACGNPVHTLGPLIHNPAVVASLAGRGVEVANDLDEIEAGAIVVRSHGITRGVMEAALAKPGCTVVDATCPHVLKVQREAERLSNEGRFVIVIGEPSHPEVEGIVSHAGVDVAVVEGVDDIPELPEQARVGVVVQTTQAQGLLDAVVAVLRERHADVSVCNTICAATSRRQQAAVDVARRCEAMIVIGGRNSGNTRRLFELCSEACANTHHIEGAAEIDPAWLAGCDEVGVTAGASTPRSQVDGVLAALEEIRP